MSALPRSNLPDDFRSELARLSRAGIPLLPLGGGTDGKAPLLRAWAGSKLALRRVLAPLYRTGSTVYGVRLDGLAVIDCDDDSPKLIEKMQARFGPSPVHVKTPRGWHLYYRAIGHVPNLRGEGLPVDIKTGSHAYLVGPLSCRPDGGVYTPSKGLLGVDLLPPLNAPQRPHKTPQRQAIFQVGKRHQMLVCEALQMVEYVDSADELLANLEGVRDDRCADIMTMPDSELRKIANWTWKCRLANNIYMGRDSAFRVERPALDAIRSCDNEPDSIALYVLLQDVHGHSPGKRFALDFKAMRNSGLTRLSIPRLRAARRSLEAVGLIRLVGKHKAGSIHQTWVLVRMRSNASDALNINYIGGRV